MVNHQGSVAISLKRYYFKIFQSFEAVRSIFRIIAAKVPAKFQSHAKICGFETLKEGLDPNESRKIHINL